jgi:hypothetical protein
MEAIKSLMDKIEERNLPPTLKQGFSFKKYQKEIITNPRAVAIANDLEEKETTTIQGFNNSLNEENEESTKVVEGFATQATTMSDTIVTPSNPVSQEILSKLSELDKLQTQYNSLLEKYNTANTSSIEKVKTTLTNITNNPYANKNVTLSDGKTYYVTNKGTSKLYDSPTTFTATNGKNNCPSGSTVLNLSSLSNVTTAGSNMVSGQSCGNEGANVFVNKTLNTPTSTYIGCYNDSTTNPTMTSVNNGSKIYNYATCQEAAINSGNSYFGLQGLDTTTNLSTCYTSNDLTRAQKYGEAKSMCNADSNGYVYGNTLVNAIYKSPTGAATYVGTYKDSPTRAMTLVNNGSNSFTYETCKQQAINTGNTYFGLQNFNSTTQTAQCAVSNDFAKASQYGEIKNRSYTGNDENTYGGSFANAIYQLETDMSNYKGCYNDKADAPAMSALGNGDSTYSFSSCKDEAVKGGYGYFALQGTSSGSSKCFASNDLPSAQKYGEAKPCNKSLDGQTYGNNGINAIYKMNELGYASSVGKMGYVDYNSNVTEFPESMIGLSLTYDKYDNYGTTLTSVSSLQNATYDTAVAKCNANSTCYGFTIDLSTNVANFYGKSIVNPSNRILKPYTTLYLRNQMLQKLNAACNKQVVNIDSSQWKNYVKKSGYMSPSSTCDLSTAIMSSSTQSVAIQNQIISTAKQIVKILNDLNKNSDSINNKTGLNTNMIQANIQKYNDVIVEMSEFTDVRENNISNIVKESDIKVLQENYGYMFWSILAITTVIVTMNVMRK